MPPFSHLWISQRARNITEPTMNMNRAIKLQCASDDIGVIADTVAELVVLLDKFFVEHADEITERLDQAWPKNSDLGPYVVRELRKLADKLAPPEV